MKSPCLNDIVVTSVHVFHPLMENVTFCVHMHFLHAKCLLFYAHQHTRICMYTNVHAVPATGAWEALRVHFHIASTRLHVNTHTCDVLNCFQEGLPHALRVFGFHALLHCVYVARKKVSKDA